MFSTIKYLLLIIFLGTAFQTKEIYKEYSGGRKGFSYTHLVLYTNHVYYYSERYDFPGTLKDEGEWQIKDSTLVLTSNSRIKENGNKKLFKGAAYGLRNDEVIIQSGKGKDKYIDILKEKRN